MSDQYKVVYCAWPNFKSIVAEGLTLDEAKEVLRNQPLPMISGNRDTQPRYHIELDT